MRGKLEMLLFRIWPGLLSRIRIGAYRMLGMRVGTRCRFEKIRIRRPAQISVGPGNAISEGCWLWPVDAPHDDVRIRIGENNYFNRDCMLDACGLIEIGDRNMFGPGVYITDSNHSTNVDQWVADAPMKVGRVQIGNGCWIGTRAVILKDVVLGDRCVVAAGAVVTKSFPRLSLIGGIPARLLRGIPEA